MCQMHNISTSKAMKWTHICGKPSTKSTVRIKITQNIALLMFKTPNESFDSKLCERWKLTKQSHLHSKVVSC